MPRDRHCVIETRPAGEIGVLTMSRACLLLILLTVGGLSVGCTACGTPYDYCSATFTGRGDPCDPCGGGDDCRENVRLGSILSDNSVRQMSYQEPTEAEDPADASQQPTEAEPLPEPDDQPTLPELPVDEEAVPTDDEMLQPELEEAPPEAAPRSSSRAPRTFRR